MKQILRFLIFNNYPHLLIKENVENYYWRMEGKVRLKFLDRKCIKCGKKIEKGYLCKDCMKSDPIIMSAKFDGFNGFILDSIKEREHVVYLAVKDGLWKVGSTQKKRFMERMLEQGIDYGGIVIESENATFARKIEKLISNLGIEDRFKSQYKIPIKPNSLIDFRKYYRIPKGEFKEKFWEVEGRVIGWKGPEIFFDNGYKTNLKWWVGTIIE